MTPSNTRAPDRRVQKTRKLLHEALLSLLHEKSYDDVVVKEILDRADVGRSTFYMHFRDKDDLLVSGMADMLCAMRPASLSPEPSGSERFVWFSLPIFEHIAEQRRARKLKMGPHGRAVLHEHLRRVLAGLISTGIQGNLERKTRSCGRIPGDLLVQHVASTFILVLNWWVERKVALDPGQADTLFRALILPTLAEN
jgi:AcrR family transcriptional regulator